MLDNTVVQDHKSQTVEYSDDGSVLERKNDGAVLVLGGER